MSKDTKLYKNKENDPNRKSTVKELNSLYERIVWMDVHSKEFEESNKRISLLELQLQLYDKEMGY
mgnify:CR=1 FL=1